jgi:hypothetical protein
MALAFWSTRKSEHLESVDCCLELLKQNMRCLDYFIHNETMCEGPKALWQFVGGPSCHEARRQTEMHQVQDSSEEWQIFKGG